MRNSNCLHGQMQLFTVMINLEIYVYIMSVDYLHLQLHVIGKNIKPTISKCRHAIMRTCDVR